MPLAFSYIICAVIGYLFGCISPSYFFSKIKKIDLRREGTGNLGASNTTIVFGKVYGIVVMFFDIAKAYLAVEIALGLFPKLVFSGLIAGTAAVFGHNFPFYLHFHGGKGLAALGGFVLAESPQMLLFLFIICAFLTLTINYICVLPVSGSILLPFAIGIAYHSFTAFFIVCICSVGVIYRHLPNIKDAREGKAPKVRSFLKELFCKEAM